MFDPFITRITIVLNGNSYRIVCHPYPFFVVYVDVVNAVAVHAIVAVVVCYDKRYGLVRIDIHLIDTSAIGSNQQFFGIQWFDAWYTYVFQADFRLCDGFCVHVVNHDAPLEGTDEQFADFGVEV